VLKSDKKVRHGEYKNLRNGQLSIAGLYADGKKAGVWKFYRNGVVVQSYNYDSSSLVQHVTDIQYQVWNNNNFEAVKIAVAPTYIGGKPGLERSLNDIMRYPQQALRMGIEGVVKFSVELNENSQVEEIEIIEGPREFYNEITTALQKIDQAWITGSDRGNKIKCKLIFSLEFKLQMCGGIGCTTMFIL
jgi:hypothetical protein